MAARPLSGEMPPTLRWFVGVPLATNPLILIDLMTILVIVGSVSWAVLLVLQLLLGGYVNLSHLYGASLTAGWLLLIMIALFAAICLVMGNRYAALYRFNEDGVYCENMRATPKASDGRLLHFRGFAIEPVVTPIRSVKRTVRWQDVKNILTLEGRYVLILKGQRGNLMRVYCPDIAMFRQALACAREYKKSSDAV